MGSRAARTAYAARRREQALGFYTLGRRVTWSGVTSTSRDEAVALRFAGPGGAVFRIRATSGVSVEAFSVFSESEVRLGPCAERRRAHTVCHRIPFRVCRPGWPLGAGASGARSREPARAVRERGRRQLDSSGAPGGPVQREDQLRGGARSTASRAARGQGFPPLCVCSRILPQQLSCTAGVPGAQLPGGGEPLCVPGPGPPGPHPGGPR